MSDKEHKQDPNSCFDRSNSQTASVIDFANSENKIELTINEKTAELTNYDKLNSAYKVKKQKKVRIWLSYLTIIFAFTIWLTGLSQTNYKQEILPWTVSIFISLIVSLVLGRISLQEESFEIVLKRISWQKITGPLNFIECFSFSLFIASILIYILATTNLTLNNFLKTKPIQVIDIEFTSNKDFENNHDLLSGTKQEANLHKRQSKSISIPTNKRQIKKNIDQQQFFKPKSLVSNNLLENQKNSNNSLTANKSQKDQLTKTKQTYSSFVQLPASWKTNNFEIKAKNPDTKFINANNTISNKIASSNDTKPYITEVPPPELVEILDNDGDSNSQNVFQKGGKSTGGKGSKSSLQEYLKELQHRIKAAWMPEKGTICHFLVQFRINRDGQLVETKIIKSSQNQSTDQSALKAIASATAAKKALPKDYPHAYIDLLYTFIYNYDEIQEVK